MICPIEKCTACGACSAVCPKEAIILKENSFGSLYPSIDEKKCINCGLCRKVCPNNQALEFKNVYETYAAYSMDKNTYNSAASGGLASELYKFAINHNWFAMGTIFDRPKGVYYKEIANCKDLNWACNSKYVYSNMLPAFKKYYCHLKNDEKALFIGLPCQCAALFSYLKLREKNLASNLYLVNIICHGVSNWNFLNEHLSFLEKKYETEISKIFFRSKAVDESHKAAKSYDYHLRCISDDSHTFYVRDMHKNETFGNAFLNNLIFRDNCYSCRYARPERFSDLTIGDYDGLGIEAEYTNSVKQVSCVLVSSPKGSELINFIKNEIYLEKRPIQEPFKMNGQLNHPSVPHKNRDKFKETYLTTQNFETAVKKSLFKEMYLSFDISGRLKNFIKRNFNFVYIAYKKAKQKARG